MRPILAAALIVLIAWFGVAGCDGAIASGSDHGAYYGLDRISAFLAAQPRMPWSITAGSAGISTSTCSMPV